MFVETDASAARLLPDTLMSLCAGRVQKSIDRPKGYAFHHILWVTEGSCTYRLLGETFTLSEGEGIYMRPNIPHQYEGENLSTAWCTFCVSEELLDFLKVGDYLRFKIPASIQRETEHLLRHALGDSTPLSRSAAGYAYVTDFFSKVLQTVESFSARIRHVLERRYAEPLTLSEIAEELGSDKYTLCHRFKREEGITVMEELTRLRIEKAKQLLRYHSDSVAEIGKACGFESPSYFGKQFRKITGTTPVEYRKINA